MVVFGLVGARRGVAVMAAALVAGMGAAGGGAAASRSDAPCDAVTSRVSVSSAGEQANGVSPEASISADGRYVAFDSFASNLVPGDTNDAADVFVRDRSTGVTRWVSVGPDGTQGNSGGSSPAISADGRYVAFYSSASNLVHGDTNHESDVFVWNRLTGVTKRVSVGPDGMQGNGDTGGPPTISAHGRYVAFESFASNLVAGDTNGTGDVFVRDRLAHTTRRVSIGPGGAQGNNYSFGPSISAHGGYVAFESWASNLVVGDTNSIGDVFVRNLSAHVTRRVSIGPGRTQGHGDSGAPSISAHGRYVAFSSYASNLVAHDTNGEGDVFVRDRSAHATRRVSLGAGGAQGNSLSFDAAMSAHGRHVAFSSLASNLVGGDTNRSFDVFVRDRSAHVTRRVSIGADGAQSHSTTLHVGAISPNGQNVVFGSDASNLVTGDTTTRKTSSYMTDATSPPQRCASPTG